MNCSMVTGVVLIAPELRERNRGTVCNFLIAVDSRAKNKTHLPCCAWDELGKLAANLAVGDHVSVVGPLSHVLHLGVVLTVKQLALRREEVSRNDAAPALSEEEPTELNWSNYLDCGREAGLLARKEHA